MQSAHPSSRLAYLAGLLGFSFVAFYGTAVLESPLSHLYKALTIPAAFGKAYLLSVVLASLLGYFIYRQWQPASALWVWTVGAFWLLLRIALLAVGSAHASLWQQIAGSACLSGVPSIAQSCAALLTSNLAVLRAFAFSLGAILCATLGHRNTH